MMKNTVAVLFALGSIVRAASFADTTLGPVRAAAFGCESIQLDGVIGRRLHLTNEAVHMMDLEGLFIRPWQDRHPGKNEPFNGLGHNLEGIINMAAYTGAPRDVALKDRIIEAILATQEPDGYIGRFAPGERGRQQRNHDTEDQTTLMRSLALDGSIFGWKPERKEATEKLARWIIDTWEVPGKQNVTSMEECFLALYKATGNREYVDFLFKIYFPGEKFSTFNWGWQPWLGYDSGQRTFDLSGTHIYRYCGAAMSQLAMNEIRPHPDLVRAAPAAERWIKDGGATLPGTLGYWERWSKSQLGRSGVHNPNLEYCCVSRMHKNGEVCSHVYVMLLLEKMFDLSAPEAWRFDVIERILYNAYFAAQSKEARPEWQGTKQRYDTAVEGPRVWFSTQTYCCPGNFRKYMFGIPRLVYKQRKDGLYVNLYEASHAELRLEDTRVRIVQKTRYPHDGKVVLEITPDTPLRQVVNFRIPAWCRNPTLSVNGRAIAAVRGDSYARVDRLWKKGDVVELNLPMGWDWIAGFREQAGRAGLMRGPLVYCLNPVRNRLPGYQDLAFEPKEYARGIKYGADQGAYAAYGNSYRKLRDLVLDPATVSAPVPDANVQPNGNPVRVRAWSSRDKMGGAPELELVLTEFPDEEGRATFFLLSDQRVMHRDPLFACELKETSLFQQKWEHEKKRLDASKLATLPWRPSRDDLLVPALRGSNLELTAEGELAGHRAWMSVTEFPTPSRRMGFRLPDDRYLDKHPTRVRFTIVYLDRGDCNVELFYDSIDSQWQVLKSRPEVISPTRRPFVASSRGAFKPGGAFRAGHSDEWRQVSFEVSDARLATQSDGKDLLLQIDRDTNFIVQGVYLQELAGGRRETNLKIPKID